MVWQWFPWRYFVRRWARKHGIFDPLKLLTRLDRIAQPSEVRAPFELIRAGIQFHGRGVMNTRVIQNNLDWEWPYWVRRQFDPTDESFLPRGFAISHVNLTHRNWTAVGLPDCNALPIVDPRGMVTPYHDGWSVTAAFLKENGELVYPARMESVEQSYDKADDNLAVETRCSADGVWLNSIVHVQPAEESGAVCLMECGVESPGPGWLVLSLRPCNPEGVRFVHQIRFDPEERAWWLDGKRCARLGTAPESHRTSVYADGDVFLNLRERSESRSVECNVGLATAAAMYRVDAGEERSVSLSIDLARDMESKPILPKGQAGTWEGATADACKVKIPDSRFQSLYETAVCTLILLSPDTAYPGPYTYKRFWFRDAALMVNSMLCAGLRERAECVLDKFQDDQRLDGYFHSQDGEWDSNGEALWAYRRYVELTGEPPKDEWRRAVRKGARWICRKRTNPEEDSPHAGLLPAGFSAEHLGNNDYYYWDDFWAVAGLRAAAKLCAAYGDQSDAEQFRNEARDMMGCVESSLRQSESTRGECSMAASPYRRMDAGAVGSLAVSYPLKLWPGDDERITSTVSWLRENCFLRGAFFHEVIHSGLNAYLSLHIAQALLREGDRRFFDIVDAVAELASSTGQWPEAIHPRTGGGCMGDGQHGWAAAEWAMMIRNMFVREERDRLILVSGIPRKWVGSGPIHFGPAPTTHGPVQVYVQTNTRGPKVSWEADWRDGQPELEVRLAGRESVVVNDASRKKVMFE